MRYKVLGKTGLQVSVLGLGGLRLPISNSSDNMQAIQVIQKAISKGINYIDTAATYNHGQNEEVIGTAIKCTDREKVIIATKCPVWEISVDDDFDVVLKSQLKRLKTSYIDCYLFHALGKQRWEQIKALKLLQKMEEAKRRGLIKHIGFSFHDSFEVFEQILTEFDGWELCQLQYSYIDTDKQAGTEGLQLAKKNNLGTIIMEPLHGGRLVNPPIRVKHALPVTKTPVEWAFDFLYDKSEIDLVLSGMKTIEEIDYNVYYASSSWPNMFSEEEREMFKHIKEIFFESPLILCTACGYCLPCPNHLNIPRLLEAYNKLGSTNYYNAKMGYSSIEIGAEMCHHCKKCESKCPQKLKISDIMYQIANDYSKPLPKLDLEALKIKWPERYNKIIKNSFETSNLPKC